ncbi:MAG: murein biosynthesis integral membrane protein MurJ [Opitutales bacterium]|jgi:putative peptidoglycan lipid II flippase
MGKLARRISEVAGWTLASRLLGLIRDILLFASLGTGPLNSAFILAFTLPNLFRRLLGEGALTSSSIPVLSESLEKTGREETFRLFNAILSRLCAGLVVLVLAGIPLFGLIKLIPGLDERWYAGADLSRILFPYVVFICAGALVCGMLNVLGRFGLAAFNQVWLNVAMIVSILGGLWLLPDDAWARVLVLSSGVIIGGLLQFGVPVAGLRRDGWRLRFSMESHPELGKILRLFLPGLLGAAIFQINILVCRLLAFSLDDTATGLLYIASRLVELPLGVFAIAVTTVIFPELSRLSASGDARSYSNTFSRGLGLIFAITLPATLGLALMASPILGFLFQWGLFESKDVAAAVPVLVVSSLGLPFFAWSTLLTRAWYARQEIVVPVRLAGLNLILNLVLGLVLMRFLGAVGLALANTVSAAIHCLALQYFMPGRILSATRWSMVFRLGAALSILAVVTLAGQQGVAWFNLSGKITDLLSVVLVIPLAAGVYLGALVLMKYPAIRYLMDK